MKQIKNFFGKFKNFFKPKIISEKIFLDWEKIFIEKIRFFIKIIILFLFVLLILNPSFWISEQDKKNISYEIVFWIDNSLSMLAKDWEEENRFQRAKNKISEIINSINWEFWLLEFSWESFISIPFTTDKTTFFTILEKTEINQNWKSWTNFKSIKKNISRIFNLKEDKDKILILLSDWENQVEWNFEDLKKNKIYIVTIWFWDENWSKISLWKDEFWNEIFKKYNWEEVFSKLDEEFLEKISEKTWWKYFFEKENNSEILEFIRKNFEKKIILEKEIEEKKYFQFFAFLIFILIIVEIFLNNFFILSLLLKRNRKR